MQFGFFDSSNIGDRLIGSEIYRQYLSSFQVTQYSYQGLLLQELTEKKKKNKLARIYSGLFGELSLSKKKELRRAIALSDGVVFSGGNLLFDLNTRTLSANKIQWIVKQCRKHNIPVLALSIGVGPFKTSYQRKRVQRVLNECTYISVRDKRSASYCSNRSNHVQDPVFTTKLFQTSEHDLLVNEKKRIGVSIINYKLTGCSDKEYMEYIHALKMIVRQLSSRYQVVLFSTETRDYEAVYAVFDACKEIPSISLRKVTTGEQLQETYQSIDILLGTRMHSMIFAIAANLPIVGISWQEKLTQFFELLGMDDRVVNINELEETQTKIIQMIQTIDENYSIEKRKIEELKQGFQQQVKEEKTRIHKVLNK